MQAGTMRPLQESSAAAALGKEPGLRMQADPNPGGNSGWVVTQYNT